MVDRYDIDVSGPFKCVNGDYVLKSDYDALAAELARVELANTRLRNAATEDMKEVAVWKAAHTLAEDRVKSLEAAILAHNDAALRSDPHWIIDVPGLATATSKGDDHGL